ncbi:hypothetical protein [Leptospira sp. id769339]|uniref:hypothetical protein n=1 Tax=Leptospira sp. id769339 TaxID=2864221 RepID=UPI0012F6AB2C|nr:hypothetical protein [Leptospira sp. id769339]MCR1792766.1 hypothetical protein [Leptospira sp. id769339]
MVPVTFLSSWFILFRKSYPYLWNILSILKSSTNLSKTGLLEYIDLSSAKRYSLNPSPKIVVTMNRIKGSKNNKRNGVIAFCGFAALMDVAPTWEDQY